MQCQKYSVVPDLDFLGVLGDVAVNGFFNLIAFAAGNSEDQVVEGGATEDINVVTYETAVSVRSDHIIICGETYQCWGHHEARNDRAREASHKSLS